MPAHRPRKPGQGAAHGARRADAAQDPRRGAGRIRPARFHDSRSSGSPAAPMSRSAPSTPISTARRPCSRRWSATCPQVRDHVAPAFEGAADALEPKAGAWRPICASSRAQGSLSNHRRGRVRRSGRLPQHTRPPPSESPPACEATAKGEIRDDATLANEVRAWAIMGMNVFLGLRFGVWGKGSGRGCRRANAMLRDGLEP